MAERELIVAFRNVSPASLLKECDACGAVVADNVRARAKHRRWHETADRVAHEAMRMRPTDRIG